MFLLLAFCYFISCKNKNKTSRLPIKPLVIYTDTNDGWGADIKLSITQMTSSDSMNTYKAISSYEGKKIGFEVSVPKNDPSNKKSFARLLTIRSLGEESDNFLYTLAGLYKVKSNNSRKFIDSISPAFVDLDEFIKSLSGNKSSENSNTKKLKLFFEEKGMDDIPELYLNINEYEHWIEIKEKDEAYRDMIIKSLTK